MDSAYLAVRADIVVLTKGLFHVRPSELEAGTKRMLLTAQAIVEGKSSDRWGHHARPIVVQFCEFTGSREQASLPWQELVEDYDVYDGEEGVSSRTGNRPLGTTKRYHVDAPVIVEALDSTGMTGSQLATETGLPERLIDALCDVEWPSISQYSLDKLESHLGNLDLVPVVQEDLPPSEAQENPPSEGRVKTVSAGSLLGSLFLPVPLVATILTIAVQGSLLFWWVSQRTDETTLHDPEVVGYWDYDGVDGQRVPDGLVLIEAPDAGLGAKWLFRLELRKHAELPPRDRQLWPVELHRASRKVCANYPGYPTYPGFIDLPGQNDDGVYLFGPCE